MDQDNHLSSSVFKNNDCYFKDLPVRLTDSGISHLYRENIDPMTLCDMLKYQINCPESTKKRKKFRKTSIEVCSNRKKKIYRILLEKDYTIDIGNYAYVVIHLEPI
jgi:hypothetical protein